MKGKPTNSPAIESSCTFLYTKRCTIINQVNKKHLIGFTDSLYMTNIEKILASRQKDVDHFQTCVQELHT